MNLLRIYWLSTLCISIVLCSTENEKETEHPKDSRILRIQPLPMKYYSQKGEEVKFHGKDDAKTTDKKSQISNRQLLNKLGLSKIRIPSSHSRKRLAVESRHRARADDSHMFIVKLPPNPYYYVNNKASQSINSIEDNNKKVSFGFRSNGKPGRIYHWNIPVLKKIISDEGRSASFNNHHDTSNIIDIKNIPTWSKPWENDAMEKAYGIFGSDENISYKKKSPSYYAPVKQKKNNFHKYFPGNGKPQGFYVIQKSHKPAYYQKLIP